MKKEELQIRYNLGQVKKFDKMYHVDLNHWDHK